MIILYIVLGLLALLLILLGIAAINAVRIKAKPAEEKNSVLEGTQLDADTYAQHLSKMVQIPTVSQKDVAPGEPFTKFRELIKELYPVLHEKMEYLDIPETIAYHYKSEHPENKPMLLMSHHDVVEASGKWSHPPFAGEIVDGIIWGRGTVEMCIRDSYFLIVVEMVGLPCEGGGYDHALLRLLPQPDLG